jgi:hypothetical protein
VPPSGERPIRAAEVVGAPSLATDLGTWQPLEHAMRTAVLAVRRGELADTGFTQVFEMRDGRSCASRTRPMTQRRGSQAEPPDRASRGIAPRHHYPKGAEMILATTKFNDYDRFMEIFSTKGADKRRLHGCKGALIFRDPNEADQVWVVFDWDEQGWKSFVSDPDVPAIMQEAGHKGKPQVAAFGGQLDA